MTATEAMALAKIASRVRAVDAAFSKAVDMTINNFTLTITKQGAHS